MRGEVFGPSISTAAVAPPSRCHSCSSSAMDSASPFTITNAMRTKFNSLGKKLHRGDIKANKMQIKDLLDDDDEVVLPTLMLLQSGLMLDLFKSNLSRRLPPCCTKMSLVPVKVQTKCVVAWGTLTMTDIKLLRKHAAKDEKVLEQFFLFSTRCQGDDAVLEHDESTFVNEMELRHSALGSPLTKIQLEDNKVDWNACGVYALCDDEAEEKAPYTHVLHRASGVKVQPPMQTTDRATLLVRLPYMLLSYQCATDVHLFMQYVCPQGCLFVFYARCPSPMAGSSLTRQAGRSSTTTTTR